MEDKTKITLAYGDGIGPNIMKATLSILDAAGARLEYDEIEVGEKLYLKGLTSGISNDSWNTIRKNKILLKAPITTPRGGGYKSLNVTIRTSLGLFANVRPIKAYSPYVPTLFPKMDVVIIRENEEDLYTGIEHQQTGDVVQCLKLISKPGSERIVRYAFEYARVYGRKHVTCMTKDNIMKQTDGLFHKIFRDVASEYKNIPSEHKIIDIGSALVAARPEDLDVIVTLNLYGDIISDIAALVAGSVGLGSSANVGETCAMFEAIHGSAPDIAGKGIANPSGLLNAALMMLVHIGQPDVAERIQNAWFLTLEDGIHTADIYKLGISKRLVNTFEFADEVIKRIGKVSENIFHAHFNENSPAPIKIKIKEPIYETKELIGVDVFVDWKEKDKNPNIFGELINGIDLGELQLKLITNRGVKVYPDGIPETYCTDHWRCRFVSKHCPEINGRVTELVPINHNNIIALLTQFEINKYDVIKTENLYTFNGIRGFSLGQGE
ncbi:MAG: NADP-dependent isocitrate dehydrogenase [bacterium]